MQVRENISLNWSRKIPSDSQVRDALGIWSQHLRIQDDFTSGITSVTRRIRYYTLLAWYWKNLFPQKIITTTDFEKIFILTCLAHHDGDDTNPHLANVHDKQKFKGEWDRIKTFDLKFNINGFGRTYYNRQLEILRCAWVDMFNIPHISLVNTKLANSLGSLSIEFFKKKSFTKDELKRFERFCICDTERNDKERDIMSKLLFGFFSKKNGEWDIDEEQYNSFMKGEIELDFKEKPFSDVLDFENIEQIRGLSLRRRNTLFMFLKIIKETTPPLQELRRYIWDSIYFRQKRSTHEFIDFGRLEKVRTYWEYLQLNVYYIYTLEMFLHIIQRIVANRQGIRKSEVLSILNWDNFYRYLSKRLEHEIDSNSTINDIVNHLEKLNKKGVKTSLDSKINESEVFDDVSNASSLENQLGDIVILLCLLYVRYKLTPAPIRKYGLVSEDEFKLDSLSIHNIFTDIEKHGDETGIFEYLTDLAKVIVNRHLFEAARRLSWGTRNWIFTEEDNSLFFARRDYVYFSPRDNRWWSIKSLLKDLQFIEEKDSKIVLTKRGREWLSKIE